MAPLFGTLYDTDVIAMLHEHASCATGFGLVRHDVLYHFSGVARGKRG